MRRSLSLLGRKLLSLSFLIALLLATVNIALAADLFFPYQIVGEALLQSSWPESVAVGDVNNDGRQDVVLATSSYADPDNDYHIFVFLQDAYGKLPTCPAKYPAGNGESIDIADMNGDGKQDVVVTAPNAVGVLLQNTAGTLEAMVTYPSGHASSTNTDKLRTGDLNNDGRTDVVSIDWGTQSHDVDVYLQNASGQLTAPVSYSVAHGGYDDLEVGDVNNDGLTDIIVMSGQYYVYDNLGVLLQNAGGTFAAPVYYDLGGNELSNGVAVGDVNNDHRQDIVVSYGGNSPTAKIGLFLQNNSGTLNQATSLDAYDCPEPLAIADVNQDGKQDVLVAHGGWNALGVFVQDNSGGLTPYALYPLPYASHYNPHGLAIGDINSDGAPDVVIADYNNGLVLLYNQHTAAIDLNLLFNGRNSPNPPGLAVLIDSTIVRSYVVRNSGVQNLTNIMVSDDSGAAITCPADTLGVHESMTCSSSGTAARGTHSITATVAAKGEKGQLVTDTATGYYLGKTTLFSWPEIIPILTRGKKQG